MGLQQGRESSVDQIEIDLSQFTFFIAVTPDKAASVVVAISACLDAIDMRAIWWKDFH